MWQRSTAVLLVMAAMAGGGSAVHDRSGLGAVLQGPGNKWQGIRQVASVDSSIPSLADRPWAIVLRRVADPHSTQQKLLKHSNIVRDVKILIDLCKEEGVFSMFHDCSYFYYCFENVASCGLKFQQVLGMCDEGYYFNNSMKDCVPEPCDPQVQNDPIYGPPAPVHHDAILPPAPATHQIPPTWLKEEPEWYSKQPAVFKTAPSWYYIPPHWYNSPPTPHHTVTHKAQASQVDQVIKRHE
ncbi:uncharacterized protein LOC123518961 isoform X2 [Portunus trituberculatus]|nr:uncharacterized protein LOC123518961 isoform X2 [Portunus trituberculatus]